MIMDRKKYITPAIETEDMTTESMLMGSKFDSNEEGAQNVTITEDEYGGKFQSRRGNLWDDDENF
jgi:hypothetical protein